MEASIKIREMDLGDAEYVAEIERSITKKDNRVDFANAIQEYIRRGDGISYVATLGDKVVGYMICYILHAGFGIERSAWIASLGVDPKYMGQGIGKRLAQVVLDRCREKGIKNVFTSVRWDSVDLLSFFKALGFDRSEFINLKRSL